MTGSLREVDYPTCHLFVLVEVIARADPVIPVGDLDREAALESMATALVAEMPAPY